jgi:hypothetical protein
MSETSIPRKAVTIILWFIAIVILPYFVLQGLRSAEKDLDRDRVGDYKVVIIDQCEYLKPIYGDSKQITHKANCKNH